MRGGGPWAVRWRSVDSVPGQWGALEVSFRKVTAAVLGEVGSPGSQQRWWSMEKVSPSPKTLESRRA